MTYQLGEAIYTDVKNHDPEAHATRKVLSELGVGLAGGTLAAAPAAVTLAVTGAAMPVIGTVVVSLIGLVAGAYGFGQGARLGSHLYEATKQAFDHGMQKIYNATIGRQVAAHNRQAGLQPSDPQGIGGAAVYYGSWDDQRANETELHNGFELAGYDIGFSTDQARRLISGFDPSGDGALSADEIAQAVRAGALKLGPGHRLTIDDSQIVHAPGLQPLGSPNLGVGLTDDGQATSTGNPNFIEHLASRVLEAGSTDDAEVNYLELRHGLSEAGWAVQPDDEALKRIVKRFDGDGDGALNRQELLAALAQGFSYQAGVVIERLAA